LRVTESNRKETKMESKDSRYLRIFQEISKTISTTLSVEQRLRVLAEGVVKALDVKGCTIRLLGDEGKELELAASYGLSDQYFSKGKVEPDKSISVAMTGQPVAIPDARTDPRIQYPEAIQKEGVVSMLSIPIVVREHVIGVMRLHSAEERDFTMGEVDFATAIAEQGGLAIENARLFEKALEEVKYLKSVAAVAKVLTSTLDITQILDLIVNKAIDILGLKACSLRLLNPKTKKLELACARGLSDGYLHKGPVDMDRSIASSMKGEVVWIEDARNDPRAQYPQEAEKEHIVSILSVPMILRDKVIGTLRLYTSEPMRFNDSQIEFAQSMAEFGALALENAKLHGTLKDDYKALMDDIQLFMGYRGSL
jgi:two-component system, NtrC family, sensor kinase